MTIYVLYVRQFVGGYEEYSTEEVVTTLGLFSTSQAAEAARAAIPEEGDIDLPDGRHLEASDGFGPRHEACVAEYELDALVGLRIARGRFCCEFRDGAPDDGDLDEGARRWAQLLGSVCTLGGDPPAPPGVRDVRPGSWFELRVEVVAAGLEEAWAAAAVAREEWLGRHDYRVGDRVRVRGYDDPRDVYEVVEVYKYAVRLRRYDDRLDRPNANAIRTKDALVRQGPRLPDAPA